MTRTAAQPEGMPSFRAEVTVRRSPALVRTFLPAYLREPPPPLSIDGILGRIMGVNSEQSPVVHHEDGHLSVVIPLQDGRWSTHFSVREDGRSPHRTNVSIWSAAGRQESAVHGGHRVLTWLDHWEWAGWFETFIDRQVALEGRQRTAWDPGRTEVDRSVDR